MKELDKLLAKYGITYTAVFVPWSKSRNYIASQKTMSWTKSLNWKTQLFRNEEPIFKKGLDFSRSIACVPTFAPGAYSCRIRPIPTHIIEQIEGHLDWAAEKGEIGESELTKVPLPSPSVADMLYDLLLEAEVFDYADFESWAASTKLNFNKNSSRAEKVYAPCTKNTLTLCNKLGNKVLGDIATILWENRYNLPGCMWLWANILQEGHIEVPQTTELRMQRGLFY